MSELLRVFEEYMKTEKRSSANTVSSYLRDVGQFEAEMLERDCLLTEVQMGDVRTMSTS